MSLLCALHNDISHGIASVTQFRGSASGYPYPWRRCERLLINAGAVWLRRSAPAHAIVRGIQSLQGPSRAYLPSVRACRHCFSLERASRLFLPYWDALLLTKPRGFASTPPYGKCRSHLHPRSVCATPRTPKHSVSSLPQFSSTLLSRRKPLLQSLDRPRAAPSDAPPRTATTRAATSRTPVP